jgi:glutaminase
VPQPPLPLPDHVVARIDDLYRRHRELPEDGAVTQYYAAGRGYYPPAEAGPERDVFGLAISTVAGQSVAVGDADVLFPLQSISKVFVHGLALADRGRERVLERVGVEPSGDRFNSLVFDEHNNRPYNPMVNAGALAATALIAGETLERKFDRILESLRCYAGDDDLTLDVAAFEAELTGADRNRATAYLMRSDGMLTGDVEAILALYLQQCSVTVTCRQLSAMAATLANGGVHPTTGRRALPRPLVRDVVSVMYTCGMYDFAGEWAYAVGVPAKSGVSGGLLVVIPGKMGIGIYSPGLDRFGNSVRATRVCQELSSRLGLHLFASAEEDDLPV